MSAPAAEYHARLDVRRSTHQRLLRLDARFAWARLAAFGLAALLLAAGIRGDVTYWALAVPIVLFVVLLTNHDRIIRARDAAARAIAFYDRGIARIEDRWIGTGEPGTRFADEHHHYANDLDLFGHGSLFELLSRARTRAGEEMLASWLKMPAQPEVVGARQAAVRELAVRLDLREALWVSGEAVRTDVAGGSLIKWAEADAALAEGLRWLALTLAGSAVGALYWWTETGDIRPAVAALALEGLFIWPLRHRIERAIGGTEAAAHELDVLASVLERLEEEAFTTPALSRLRGQLDTEGGRASGAIRALDRLIEMHDWHHNLVFRFLSLPLMWRLQIALAIERWRARHGRHVSAWIATVAEFEALGSLAAYRYEHPDDPFPEIVAAADGIRAAARFEGTGLGHPLLPAARMVRNDVCLDERTQLLVVSGSNMSGKSTLLRTAGINAVLALAGAPVRAASLRISPLAVGATLRIQDSLQEGRSRFFAEITRIRELADAANGPAPLLFLLDELFHGTNSHDRLVGASGVLRSLLDRGAIGLITTHDLALTAIADDLAPRAANIHFEDTFEGGEIRFDYRARPGRVTRSNALSLMRAVGLDVAGPVGPV